MPRRKEKLGTGNIYHVLNRGVDQRTTFEDNQDFLRFLNLLAYYLQGQRLPYSQAQRAQRLDMHTRSESGPRLVKLLCFCIMPNHFHLLLHQECDGGISRYLQQIENGYARYFNTRYRRTGHLFSGQFRAIRIYTDEQFLHVTRYIHVNPHVAGLTRDVFSYPWSSLPWYTRRNLHSESSSLISEVRKKLDLSTDLLSQMIPAHEYERFLTDHAEYARELASIKHLLLEEQTS